MAKSQINTKSSSYQRDKESFLKELKQFNDSKSIPYKVPRVNGIEIDLYHFYTLVQQKGGLSKVNQSDTWDTFLRPLRLPHPCINGSTLLKRIYSMYLEKYERAKGPPGRDDDNDMDEDPRRTRGGGIPRITFSGGTYISGDATSPKHTNSLSQAGPTALTNRNIDNQRQTGSASLQNKSNVIGKQRRTESAQLRNRTSVSDKQRSSLSNIVVDQEPDSLKITSLVKYHKMSCLERPKPPDSPKLILKPKKPQHLPPKLVVFPKPPKLLVSPKRELEPTASTSQVPLQSKRKTKLKSAFSKKHYSKKISLI